MDKHINQSINHLDSLMTILPFRWHNGLLKIKIDDLCEIRIRVDQPILLKFVNRQSYFGEMGMLSDKQFAFYPTKKELEDIVFLSCNKSIYAYVGQLLKGFLTYRGGMRIGVCGEVVMQEEKPIGIKNFSSVNIRIPHDVKNCALAAKKFFTNPLKSVLVISLAGGGKTTFLRDMIFQLKGAKIDTLLIDEREELAGLNNGKLGFELNESCDVLTNCSKKFAFEWGIRSLSPELIVCDELFDVDMGLVDMVAKSGIKIFASVHADSVFSAIEKLELERFNNIFETFILLGGKHRAGKIEGIYNKKLEKLL